MNNKPLLSICIPTYNRSSYLKKCLDSIITQKEFNSGNVEIVISDNCSTDDTGILVQNYTAKYDNIKYFRNDNNIKDANFPLVLSRGKGVYRKLLNDTVIFKEDSLNKMINLINTNIIERPFLFFPNLRSKNKRKIIKISNIESFLYHTSFYCTWIGGFGLWEDDCKNIEEQLSGCDKYLWQTEKLINILKKNSNSIIVQEVLFIGQEVQQKDLTYGFYNVFYNNYLDYIQQLVNEHQISIKCKRWLEKDLLFRFFAYWIVATLTTSNFIFNKKENIIKSVFNQYKKKKYFPLFILKLIILYLRRLLVLMMKKILSKK